jgi:hypothetical protein
MNRDRDELGVDESDIRKVGQLFVVLPDLKFDRNDQLRASERDHAYQSVREEAPIIIRVSRAHLEF